MQLIYRLKCLYYNNFVSLILSHVLKDNLLQTSLAQERARWKREEESVRNKAVEAAVAIAEVKWLEEEQKKISEAVEQAMQTARETWQEEKTRDIGMICTKMCNMSCG